MVHDIYTQLLVQWRYNGGLQLYISKMTFTRRKCYFKAPSNLSFISYLKNSVAEVLSMLESNNIFYVIVPPNCTDTLQPYVSINKPTKDFLCATFHEWYGTRITKQLDSSPASRLQPVISEWTIVKAVGARWVIQLYDYLKSKLLKALDTLEFLEKL